MYLLHFMCLRPYLFISVQDSQQQVLWGEKSTFLLQGEARQESTFLVVTLSRLLTQPRHSAGVCLTGTQWDECGYMDRKMEKQW